MTVAIVIPTQGKRPEYLSEAISSLLHQTRQPDEIIIRITGKEESESNGYHKLNTAISETACDAFITFSDDDLLEPTYIEETMRELENADCVYTNLMSFGEQTGEHRPSHLFPFFTALYRKSLWEQIGGYKPEAGAYADSLFGRKAFALGRCKHIDKPLYRYRVHPTQHTRRLEGQTSVVEYAKLYPFL